MDDEFRRKYEMDISAFERLLKLIEDFGLSNTPDYQILVEDYKKWKRIKGDKITQLRSSSFL